MAAVLPWLPPGSYSATARFEWRQASDDELHRAAGQVAALTGSGDTGRPVRLRSRELDEGTCPSIANAAGVPPGSTRTENFVLGEWGFFLEGWTSFDSGRGFASTRSWHEGVLTKVEMGHAVQGGGAKGDPKIERRGEIELAPGQPFEYYRGALEAVWVSVQRARVILAALSWDRAIDFEVRPEPETGVERFRGTVQSDEPAWGVLERVLRGTGLESFNGELALPGSRLECRLVERGTGLIWSEDWFGPDGSRLLERQVVWQGGVPATTRERMYIAGTSFLYREASTAVRAEEGADPSIPRLPSLEGISVYDYRTDPPGITHPW